MISQQEKSKVKKEILEIQHIIEEYAKFPREFNSLECAVEAYHIARQTFESYWANLQAQSADWRG